jgi:hypothetical protein
LGRKFFTIKAVVSLMPLGDPGDFMGEDFYPCLELFITNSYIKLRI